MSPVVKVCLNLYAPSADTKGCCESETISSLVFRTRAENYASNDDYGGDSKRSSRVLGRVSETQSIKSPVFWGGGLN